MVDFEEVKCDNRQRKCQPTVLRVYAVHLSDDHDNLTVMMTMSMMMWAMIEGMSVGRLQVNTSHL